MPIQAILIDSVPGYIGINVLVFEGGYENLEEIAVEGFIAEDIRLLLDFLIVVDVLLQIQIVLAVLLIVFDKLAGYGIHGILEDVLDDIHKEGFFLARQARNTGNVQA